METPRGEALHGGIDALDADGEPIGVLGLLAHDPKRQVVYALSHAGVAWSGRGPGYRAGERSGALWPNAVADPPPPQVTHPDLAARSICSLIAAYPVPPDVPVSPFVVGMDELGTVDDALPLWRALGRNLRLVVGRTYTQWRIRKVGAVVTFEDAGEARTYADAVLCAPHAETELTGLGGAVFFTPDGHPVGMLIGARDGLAVMAPLRPYMWRAGLEPLSPAAAAVRNGEAGPQRAEPEPGPPSVEAVALAREPSASPAPLLNYARDRSYRFALLPLRDPPVPDELEGLQALRGVLPAARGRRGRSAHRAELTNWLMAGVRAHAMARNAEDLRRAFVPLLLHDPDRPAREVMGALAAIDAFKPIQAAEVASRYLQSHTSRLGTRQRTNLWWIAQEFLSRLDEDDLPFELCEGLFRAARTRLEICADGLLETPGEPALEREFFAALETLLAYPGPINRAGILYAVVRRLAPHSPALASFAAARHVLQVVRSGLRREIVTLLDENREYLAVVRSYEAQLARARPGLQSRFDVRLAHVLSAAGVAEAAHAEVFELIAQFVRAAPGAEPPTDAVYAAWRARDREAFARLVQTS